MVLLDVFPYLDCLQRCREQFRGLHVIAGVELGEPHWHGAAVARLLSAGQFDRVLGSLHCLRLGRHFPGPDDLYQLRPAAWVIREYLAETARLIEGTDTFSVLAHIDYPLRYWPHEAGRFDPGAFEEEFRHTLGVLADSGRALEINTEGPLLPEITRWWHEEGGTAVAFGSDAHEPARVADRFAEATAMAEASGFQPGSHPYEFWRRAD